MKNNHILFSCLLAVALFYSCSVKKNSAPNRFYHQTTAWFNTLFNANEALKKEMKQAAQESEDDYSEILEVSPGQIIVSKINTDAEYEYQDFKNGHKKKSFKEISQGLNKVVNLGSNVGSLLENNTNPLDPSSAQVKSQRPVSQEKAIKAIENHSMYIKGKERNAMMAKAFLILGKSYYFEGKSYEALDAFNHLDQNVQLKKEKKNIAYKQEAEFWIAKANLQAGNTYYAKENLKKLYNNENINKETKKDIALLYSQIVIDEKKYTEATESLERAISLTKDKKEKARLCFIQAQLKHREDKLIESSRLYDKVIKYHPGFEMEFQAKMGIASNFDPTKNDEKLFQKELDALLKNTNYTNKKATIYQYKGLVATKAKKEEQALEFYHKALINSGFPDEKVATYKQLAELYYSKGDLMKSATYYDSAYINSQKESEVKSMEKMVVPLKKLKEAFMIVERNDSILSLADLPEDAQRNQIEKYIQKENSQRAKLMAKNNQNVEKSSRNNNQLNYQSQTLNTSGSFYFYNPGLKEKGKREFKLLWGDRALVDNWRSQNKANTQIEEVTKQETNTTESLNMETLLAQLPNTPEKKLLLKQERDSAQYVMGSVYKELVEYKKAQETYESLLTKNPAPNLKMDTYYQLFLLLKEQKLPYDKYQTLLLEEFPNAPFAAYVRNPEAENFVISSSNNALSLYESAYKAYKNEDWNTYNKISSEAIATYGKEEIIAKFALLHAYYTSKTSTKEQFIASLENIVTIYPNLAEGKKAQALLVKYYELNPAAIKTDQQQQWVNEEKTKKELEKVNATETKIISDEDGVPQPPDDYVVPEVSEEEIRKIFGR